MAAHIQNRRQPFTFSRNRRPIQIPGYVKTRTALIMEVFNHVTAALESPGDCRVQWRSLRQRPKTEHVEILILKLRFSRIPIVFRLNPLHERIVNIRSLALEEILNHWVTRFSAILNAVRLRQSKSRRQAKHGKNGQESAQNIVLDQRRRRYSISLARGRP